MARLAALNITKEGRKRLIEAQKGEFLPTKNFSEGVTALQMAHLVLAEISGNRFLEAIAKSMLRLTREIVEAVEPDYEALHSPGEHRPIIEAVFNGKASDAVSAMTDHLEKFYDRLVKMEEAYRKKVSWGQPREGAGKK